VYPEHDPVLVVEQRREFTQVQANLSGYVAAHMQVEEISVKESGWLHWTLPEVWENASSSELLLELDIVLGTYGRRDYQTKATCV